MDIKELHIADLLKFTQDELDEILTLIKYIKVFSEEKNVFKIDFYKMPFGYIKDFQSDLQKELTFEKQHEIIKKFSKCENLKLLDFCQFWNFLLTGIIRLTEIESDMLSSDTNTNTYGLFDDIAIYLQFHDLTNQDVTKYESVYNTEYGICFIELLTRSRKAKFERLNMTK